MWNLLKVNGRNCVSLLTTCNMPKIFFKCFPGILWTCFWCTVSCFNFYDFFFDVFIVNLNRFHTPWSTISVISFKAYIKSLARMSKSKQYKKQPEVFLKNPGLTNFAVFIGKHLWWSLFTIKLQAWMTGTLLKRDSNAVVFQWELHNF